MTDKLRATAIVFSCGILLSGCAPEPAPELRFVAYGTEPAWTIHVWSDTLTLRVADDHGAHRFAVPPSVAGLGSFQTSAGDMDLGVEVGDEPCATAGGEGRAAVLSFGGRSFDGCARAASIAISVTSDPGGQWVSAAPAGWQRVNESRGDTTAITWGSPDGDAELTVVSMRMEGGYEEEALFELAESFGRARWPELEAVLDEAIADPPGGGRLPFVGAIDGARRRGLVDVEQEEGRLRLIALRGGADAAVWSEASLLLGTFRWLTRLDPLPAAEAPAAES